MLDALNLCCERHDRPLFTDLTFTVAPGTLVHITGENGAGKTTLLRLLAGLTTPESGEVRWQGQPLSAVRGRFHQQLLWIGHRPGVKARLTVGENLRCCQRVSDDALAQALAGVGLEDEVHTLAGQLSAGQQRRVALARLWLSAAPLWLLDEPFTAIDAGGVAALSRRIAAHAQRGGAVVFTSHQPLDIATLPLQRIALAAGATCC